MVNITVVVRGLGATHVIRDTVEAALEIDVLQVTALDLELARFYYGS